MVHTVSVYPARFTICSHRYIQKRKIRQDMGKFTFSILLKQKQKSEKQSIQGYMAEIMQRLDDMLWQVNPLAG